MYIVFEGIDTVGKSTQISLLKKKLDDISVTKEPGGTKFGMSIREIILHNQTIDHITELLLFLADRREHFIKIIKPLIDNKQTVVSDRSFLSGIAYAMSNQTLLLEKLLSLNELVLNNSLPNGVLLFVVSKETLIKRLKDKRIDSIEKRGIDYLLDVQKNLIYITKNLNLNHVIIDASEDILSISKLILQFIKSLREGK